MRMHIGRKVAAFGLAAMVVCGAAGTALAASGGTSGAPAGTASAAAAGTSATTITQSTATTTLTYAQLAAKLGVSEKQLLAAVGDFKDTVTSIPGAKSAADLKSIMVKTLVYDLHISGSAAIWAADELLGGHVSN